MLSDRFATIWMFLMILLSSRASVPANSDVVIIVFTIFTSIIFFHKKQILTTRFISFIIGFIFLTILYFIIFQHLQVWAYGRLLVKLFLAYFIVGIFKENFIFYAEKIIFYLAVISLPLYTLQLLIPSRLHELNSLIERALPFLEINGPDESNSFIFNIEIVGAPFRNSGFAWEPGGFSAFLTMALFFNLYLNNFKFNNRFWTLLIADLTTQSTTGYIAIVFIFIFLAYNRFKSKSIFLAPILFFVFIGLSQLSFVGKEIEEEFFDSRTSIDFEKNFQSQDFVSLGRIGSFIVDYNDFLKHPIIGYGMEEHERTQGSFTKYMRTNGLSEHLARFGLFGLLFHAFGIYNFSRTYFGSSRGTYIFIFTIFLISFSNPILDEKFFLCFIVSWTQKILMKPI